MTTRERRLEIRLTAGLAAAALVGLANVGWAEESPESAYVADAGDVQEGAPVAEGQEGAAPEAAPAEAPKRRVAGIEEITITARKREESLQDTPISVTAFSASDLVEAGVGRADDIGKFTPNLQFNQSANGQNSARLNIRGVGTNDPIATRDPGVGIYVDGVYLARAQGQLFGLVDIERIEVLRGPQGTLFGRNTVGGAVNVISKKPGDEFEANGTIRAGNFDLFESRGTINIPLVPEKAAMRLSFSSVSREGYGKNKLIGQEVDDRRSLGVRAALRLNPSDSVEWILTGEQSRGHSAGRSAECRPFDFNGDGALTRDDFDGDDNILGPPPGALVGDDPAPLIAGIEQLGDLAAQGVLAAVGGPGPESEQMFRPMANCLANKEDGNEFKFESPVRSKDNLDAYGLASNITWDLESSTFKSISSWRRQDIEDNQDFSFSRFTVGNVTAKDVEFDQVSQEFNLSGNGLDNKLNWTVGAFGFYEKTRPGLVRQAVSKDVLCATVTTLGPLAPVDRRLAACGATSLQRLPRLRTVALSGYGQFTYDIMPFLHFTGGLRYSTESKTFSARQQNFSDAFNTEDALMPLAPVDGASDSVNAKRTDPNRGGRVQGGRTTSERFGKFTPLLSLSLDLSENATSYLTYSKGFKSGGFNGRPNANVPISLDPFDQEVLNNYEFGVKAGFFDRRLVGSVSVFYSLYDDIQQTLLLASTAGDFASRVANAGEAVIRGAEIELRALPIPALDLRIGLGFTDAEYREFDDLRPLGVGAELVPVNRREEEFFNTPNFTGTFSAAYTFYDLPIGDLTTRLNWFHQNAVNFSPQSDLLKQGTLGLLSGTITLMLPDGKTEVALFGENLLDRRYISSGIGFEDGFLAGFAYFGPPRMYGVEIRRSF